MAIPLESLLKKADRARNGSGASIVHVTSPGGGEGGQRLASLTQSVTDADSVSKTIAALNDLAVFAETDLAQAMNLSLGEFVAPANHLYANLLMISTGGDLGQALEGLDQESREVMLAKIEKAQIIQKEQVIQAARTEISDEHARWLKLPIVGKRIHSALCEFQAKRIGLGLKDRIDKGQTGILIDDREYRIEPGVYIDDKLV